MKETTLLIHNRKYRIFCEGDQEKHVQQLGQKLSKYLEELKLSEKQLIGSEAFLMLCLNLINELEELKRENMYTRANSIASLQDDDFMENLHIIINEMNTVLDKIESSIK